MNWITRWKIRNKKGDAQPILSDMMHFGELGSYHIDVLLPDQTIDDLIIFIGCSYDDKVNKTMVQEQVRLAQVLQWLQTSYRIKTIGIEGPTQSDIKELFPKEPDEAAIHSDYFDPTAVGVPTDHPDHIHHSMKEFIRDIPTTYLIGLQWFFEHHPKTEVYSMLSLRQIQVQDDSIREVMDKLMLLIQSSETDDEDAMKRIRAYKKQISYNQRPHRIESSILKMLGQQLEDSMLKTCITHHSRLEGYKQIYGTHIPATGVIFLTPQHLVQWHRKHTFIWYIVGLVLLGLFGLFVGIDTVKFLL